LLRGARNDTVQQLLKHPLNHDESLLEQKQFHGIIDRINEQEGIVMRLQGSDEEYKLPPDLNALQAAPKGEYRLRATEGIVIDSDLLIMWTVTKPKPEK
jgi:hypothetical protein